MASKRRGGGFRPPELRGTLGTLVRTALEQASGVREALERGARTGRERFDEYRADRRRAELVAELGEVVLDLIRRGEIDLDELPEARDLVRHLDQLDADADAEREDAIPPPRVRSRFDERGRGRDADDGTVSSGARWRPPRPAASRAVWRPPVADAPSDALSDPAADDAEPAPARRSFVPNLPQHPHRKGGISFDDDDLEDYMHPDDVPPRDRTDEDS